MKPGDIFDGSGKGTDLVEILDADYGLVDYTPFHFRPDGTKVTGAQTRKSLADFNAFYRRHRTGPAQCIGCAYPNPQQDGPYWCRCCRPPQHEPAEETSPATDPMPFRFAPALSTETIDAILAAVKGGFP